MAARGAALADAVARAALPSSTAVSSFWLAGSQLIGAGWRAGLQSACEVFADRAYRPNGTLVSRQDPGAVIHDHETVVAGAVRVVRDRTVEAIDGSVIPLTIDTVCSWRYAGCSKSCRWYSRGAGRSGIEVRRCHLARWRAWFLQPAIVRAPFRPSSSAALSGIHPGVVGAGRSRQCRGSLSVALCPNRRSPTVSGFALQRVGHPGDSDFHDGGMGGEHFFNLARPYLIGRSFSACPSGDRR